jgi:hypothetical protein
LRPGLHWVRNDATIWLVVRDDRPPLTFNGAEALLLELWIRGRGHEDAITEVAACYRLGPADVHRRLAALIRRLEDAGAVTGQAEARPGGCTEAP